MKGRDEMVMVKAAPVPIAVVNCFMVLSATHNIPETAMPPCSPLSHTHTGCVPCVLALRLVRAAGGCSDCSTCPQSHESGWRCSTHTSCLSGEGLD